MMVFQSSSDIILNVGIRTAKLGRIMVGFLKNFNSQSGCTFRPSVSNIGGEKDNTMPRSSAFVSSAMSPIQDAIVG